MLSTIATAVIAPLVGLVRLLAVLREDACTAIDRDPSVASPLVVLLYPGVHAVWAHRVAGALHRRGYPLAARVCSLLARVLTGVDIHPGATVGRRVFLDHATGVTVGETADVGDDVLLYQGVTLGARETTDGVRHPTVEDGVTLGANATVLGPVTVGEDATVGAGAVVVDDVGPAETVVGVPAEPVASDAGNE